jgi:hypothetical protein
MRKMLWLFLALIGTISRSAAEDVWQGVERVVAVGDVHGDLEQLVKVLRFAGVVDEQTNWSGGKTHLVQTGDVVDRGPAVRGCLDLFMKLEKQAPRQGGRVHCLLGNHESMNLYGDYRYVSAKTLEAFRGPKSKAAGDSPAGMAEYQQEFGPDGKYGRWIRNHNTVIRIDGAVFLHGGIGPKYGLWSIRKINEEVRADLADFNRLPGGIVQDPDGPLWYRGLATGDELLLGSHLATTLHLLKAGRMVVSHTFTDGAVTPRFDGKLLMIDIGLARIYDQFTRLACLVVENGKPYALHNGARLELPADGSSGALLAYLKAASAADPQPSSLTTRIAKLEASLALKPK